MNTNGASTSLWMQTQLPRFPAMPADCAADVCVIGAGIAGLSTAYLLAREGQSVVVIDALEPGAGETGRTTAHFFPPDERYCNIEDAFGADMTRLVADSYRQAIALVESIIHHEGIRCEFQRLDGYLFAPDAHGRDLLRREETAARKAGVAAGLVDRVPGLQFDTGPALRFAEQAQFHPLKYLAGLAHGVLRQGGQIFSRTRATSLSSENERQLVHTASGIIRAKAVVVATNTPFNDRVVMHTKQAGYRSYVIGVRVPRGSVPPMLLWDTSVPYYYVRLADAGADAPYELLIAGGADHKVGQDVRPQHRYGELENWVRARFPMAGQTDFRWSGEVMEPADGLAFLGRNPMDSGNVYLITGDSGNGMTHCTAGAILVSDLIMGREHPWAALYDPARKPLHGVGNFLREQANTLAQYGEWLTGGEVESAREIAHGQGAIVREGMRKLAVYRDSDGGLHVLSATCTHLGGIVAWNAAERSWDCPCHASRFDVDGDVLHGPAVAPLPAETLHEPLATASDSAMRHPVPPPVR